MNNEVALVEFKLLLNTKGELVIVRSSASPDELEQAFEEWNPEYEYTHNIVSLVRESDRLLGLLTKQLEAHVLA